ncbi:MAG: hypothetical protein RSA91_05450 [Bacilli bacterium]
MEITKLQIILFGLCALSVVAIIIFALRNNDKEIDYDRIIRRLNERKIQDLNILDRRNKEINKIEEKILTCKKELNMKLFDK